MTLKNFSSWQIFFAIIIAGLIIAGAILYTRKQPDRFQKTPKEEQPSLVKVVVTEEDHIRGNPEASVTIVEYSDFQCPFCARFHPTIQRILEEYPGKVRWVYRHFPLDQIHPQARPAAEASECAAEQNKFWEFADGLFENQTKLGNALYSELAQNFGIDMEQFENCISERKYKDKVESDYQDGIKAGVRGTPGSFVNGQSVPGAVPYETLKAVVEDALANL